MIWCTINIIRWDIAYKLSNNAMYYNNDAYRWIGIVMVIL